MDVDIANWTVIIDQFIDESLIEPDYDFESTSSCYTIVDDNKNSKEHDVERN